MKKILFIILILSFPFGKGCGWAVAQNLVPNPSFEIVNSCSDSAFQSGIYIGNYPFWSAASAGNPDGFNVCDTSYFYTIPHNFRGFQYPHSGNGYAAEGFWLGGIREYSEVRLNSPLIDQEHYCCSYYVSLANTFNIA
jgi:hypothetical protein